MRLRIVLASLFAACTACAGDGGTELTLDEYSIEPSPVAVESGEVVLRARNTGSISHQLIVLRTEADPGELPVAGGVVVLPARGVRELGRVDLVSPGAAPELRVQLPAGAYVLICNIAGHYGSGMWAPLRAR